MSSPTTWTSLSGRPTDRGAPPTPRVRWRWNRCLPSRRSIVDNHPPPFEHLPFLDRHWAGGSGVDDPLQAREIVGVPLLVLQPEHAGEHGGNELGVGDVVSLDGLEAFRRIERLHDHTGRTEPVHRHRVDERCGMIERSRGEVDPSSSIPTRAKFPASITGVAVGSPIGAADKTLRTPWAIRWFLTDRASLGPRLRPRSA